MKAAMIAPNGRLLSIIDVQDFALAQLGVPAPNFLIGIAPDSLDFYWNGTEFVSLGTAPNEYCFFDYELREWIDPRGLDDLKNAKWAELRAQRDAIEYGGFEFNGDIFDSDVTAQARISAAASLGVSVDWTTQSNTVVTLSAAQLEELLKALAAHVSATHERGRIARAAVVQATSVQDVLKVEL